MERNRRAGPCLALICQPGIWTSCLASVSSPGKQVQGPGQKLHQSTCCALSLALPSGKCGAASEQKSSSQPHSSEPVMSISHSTSKREPPNAAFPNGACAPHVSYRACLKLRQSSRNHDLWAPPPLLWNKRGEPGAPAVAPPSAVCDCHCGHGPVFTLEPRMVGLTGHLLTDPVAQMVYNVHLEWQLSASVEKDSGLTFRYHHDYLVASAKEEEGSGGGCVLALCHPRFIESQGGARLTDRQTEPLKKKVPPREAVPPSWCWPVSEPETQLVLLVTLHQEDRGPR